MEREWFCFIQSALNNYEFNYRLVAYYLGILMGLSTRVFETRTATGSELFLLSSCPHTTTFTLLSIVSPLKMSSREIWETIRF